MKLILATNNAHKMREIFEILGSDFPEMQTLKQAGLEIDVVEDGDTFEANATKKALAVARATGLGCLADDSGLEWMHWAVSRTRRDEGFGMRVSHSKSGRMSRRSIP